MLRRYLWAALALLIVGLTVLEGQDDLPETSFLSQCNDKIEASYPICRKRTETMKWCYVYLINQWRIGWCLVDVYEQPRPAPLPPSIYFTKFRNCAYSSSSCIPKPQLICPTPQASEPPELPIETE